MKIFQEGDYQVKLDFRPGWVNLSLEDYSRSGAAELGTVKSEMFNPLKLEAQKRDLARELAEKAYDGRADGSGLCAAFYDDDGSCLIDLSVHCFGDEGESPTPTDVQPVLLTAENAELASRAVVTYLDVPAGPAVRVQGVFKAKKWFGFGKSLTEVVKYAVCPTVNSDVLIITAQWKNIEFSEGLAEIVDELPPTLKLIASSSDGQVFNHPSEGP